MKKVLIFIVLALLITSCTITKPKYNNKTDDLEKYHQELYDYYSKQVKTVTEASNKSMYKKY